MLVTANTKNNPHTTKPQPWYGIICPLVKYDVRKIPIGRVINCVAIKNVQLISVSPATRHSISSGKKGSSIISTKLYFPLLKNLVHFSQLSFPTMNTTIFFPKLLPMANATALPSSIPARLNSPAWKGPYIIVPATTKIGEGIGINVTCKN